MSFLFDPVSQTYRTRLARAGHSAEARCEGTLAFGIASRDIGKGSSPKRNTALKNCISTYRTKRTSPDNSRFVPADNIGENRTDRTKPLGLSGVWSDVLKFWLLWEQSVHCRLPFRGNARSLGWALSVPLACAHQETLT